MPWLAGHLLKLVGWIVGLFGLKISQKALFGASALAAFVAITSAFVLATKALVIGLVWSLPAWAAPGVAAFLPTNTALCIGAVLGVKMARAIYNYHVTGLKLVSYIT